MEPDQNQFFEAALFQTIGQDARIERIDFIAGGCIHNSVKLSTKTGVYFIKWNETQPLEIFAREAEGLELLRAHTELKIPQVLGFGAIDQKCFLLLEFIDSRFREERYWETLGQGLAHLHAHTHPQYGLETNNFIGSLRQSNEGYPTWPEFFIERRLKVQLGLAYYNGLIDAAFLKRAESLYAVLEANFFPKEPPALLHGDLWSGNLMVGRQGEPVLVDPAVYYGHREMELAFTRLFGGYTDEFYAAYDESWPLEPGFEDRKDVYSLYPLLVHVTLFGTSYLSGVTKVLDRYC